jgi:hypothetical protein
LVQSVNARLGINVARYKTCVGRNALFCCNYLLRNSSDILTGNVSLSNYCFTNFCATHRSSFEVSNAISLYEVLLVREGWLTVENFSRGEFDTIIAAFSR